jgi:hypothetical protein
VFNGTTKLKTIYLNNSDVNTINLIITILLSRSVSDPGVIYIAGVDDISQVNIGAAQAKYWNIINENNSYFVLGKSKLGQGKLK